MSERSKVSNACESLNVKMPSLVTFCGIRRGVGNATLARAFAGSAAESNECLLIEADRCDDTSLDWAERRRRTRRYGHFMVRSVSLLDYEDVLDSSVGIVILQATHLDDMSALTIVRKSRLFVLTTTPSAEDLEAAERLLQHLLKAGIRNDSLAVVLSNPIPASSNSNVSPALQRIWKTGIKAFDIPFLGSHAAGPLKDMGWTIEESNNSLPAQTGERVIDFLQKAFVGRS